MATDRPSPPHFRLNPPHSQLKRYGYAVLAAAVATVARLVASYFGYEHQFALLYIAVLWSSWYGGMWPALATAGLGSAVVAFLAVHGGHLITGFQPANLKGVEFYAMVTLTAAALFEAEKRARRRASQNAEEARRRLEQFQRESGLRKAAERAASTAEEQFRLAVEYAPVGICRLSLGGRFEEVNPQFCAITGYSREELIGRAYGEISHPEDLGAADDGYRAILSGARPFFSLEQRYIRKDGAPIWANTTAATVSAGAEGPQFVLAVVQDITGRREAEEQIRETQRLESIGRLAGGIAHDFNNLLTAMLGNASLAIESLPKNSSERLLIESVVAAADRAASLTRQLLAYAGKGQFQRTAVDLSEITLQASELIRVAVPENVDLRMELSPALPAVCADPAQIQQMVTNLAMNAVEAIGEEPGEITIRTERAWFPREDGTRAVAVGKLKGGEYLRLVVEDNGSGMDEVTIRRIFDPFFTTRFMGRGLGLAAVAGIVRSLDGAVRVKSAPGQGTTMEILIPVAQRDDRATVEAGYAEAEER